MKRGRKKGYKVTEEVKERLRKAHIGKTHTIEHRKRVSESKKGKNHWNWKGGITSMNRRLRESLEYRLWREAVFKRDNYQCIWCKAKNGGGRTIVLNADHIRPFALYPELRFSIDNGRTLCIDCHRTTKTYGYTKEFRKPLPK